VSVVPKTQPTVRVKAPIKRIIVDIPASLHQRVRITAAERSVTMREVIRAALEHEIAQRPRKAKAA
jgi:hypothetical protein